MFNVVDVWSYNSVGGMFIDYKCPSLCPAPNSTRNALKEENETVLYQSVMQPCKKGV